MELKSLVDYRNVKFTIHTGGTTIGRDDISEDEKQYLIDNFPEEFVETSEEEEAALVAERLKIEAIQKANIEATENAYDPFTVNAMTTKEVESVENQEDKLKIESNDTETKTKAKKK